jgi:hypothetical protein
MVDVDLSGGSGAGPRRRRSAVERRRVVEETLEAGASVARVSSRLTQSTFHRDLSLQAIGHRSSVFPNDLVAIHWPIARLVSFFRRLGKVGGSNSREELVLPRH